MKMLVLAVLATMSLAACGAPQGYDETYQSNFMNSCTREGGTPAACSCIWNKIAEGIPRADMDAMEAAASRNESHPVRDQVVVFAQECAHLQQ